MNNLCPCGLSRPYNECCGSIINSKTEAATCEELMRSRYVAFVKANVDYLLRSHCSKTRPLKERKAIEKWTKSVDWMGLTVLNTEAGGVSDDVGYVEFRALFVEAGKMQEIHENSRFKRENKKWVYVESIPFS
jgi:SEC-C motif-containing protein